MSDKTDMHARREPRPQAQNHGWPYPDKKDCRLRLMVNVVPMKRSNESQGGPKEIAEERHTVIFR